MREGPNAGAERLPNFRRGGAEEDDRRHAYDASQMCGPAVVSDEGGRGVEDLPEFDEALGLFDGAERIERRGFPSLDLGFTDHDSHDAAAVAELLGQRREALGGPAFERR